MRVLYPLFVLAFGCGFYYNITIVGQISYSELFAALVFVVYGVWRHFKVGICDSFLRSVTILYACLLAQQMLSELFVSNGLDSSLKGLATTVMSFTVTIFTISLLKRGRNGEHWLFLSIILARLLTYDNEYNITPEEVLEGEKGQAYTFFKFKVAPMLAFSLVYVSLFIKSGLLFFFIGCLFVVLGARSVGFSLIFVGFLSYINFRTLSTHVFKIILLCSFAVCVLYPIYCLYVDKILSGEITGGNSRDQIKVMSNPYNPFELLFVGRKDALIPLICVIESPLLGLGSWYYTTYSRGSVYVKEMIFLMYKSSKIKDTNIYFIKPVLIGAHSIIFCLMLWNGVLAGLLAFLIVVKFIRIGFRILNVQEGHKYMVLFIIFQLFWNSLFSPIGHFRTTFPLYFAILYHIYNNEKLSLKQ